MSEKTTVIRQKAEMFQKRAENATDPISKQHYGKWPRITGARTPRHQERRVGAQTKPRPAINLTRNWR